MARQVLVAEDDSSDAYLLQRAFVAAGEPARLKFVRDGQEAIDYLERGAAKEGRTENPMPDLLLLDLKMPKLDGFDVLCWLRNQPGLKRLLVIILTSSDQPQDINRAYDLGANSYLVKPHNPHSLSELVRRIQNYWFELNHSASPLAP